MILVTGGARFIGSHVVERPGYLDPRAELVEGDVRDPDVVARAVDGVSAVSHQAAMVGLGVRGRIVLGSSMVVYGEGRYRCPDNGIVRPGPRRAQDLDLGFTASEDFDAGMREFATAELRA